ncbi:kinetochore Sim4 complex subunit FTA2-domain-containing protein [Nemania sp. FL0916]|nr:kinetochore Sim4 complex subunit FTA2-domain-containing protein [Nemania sp. FL0916]
MGSTVEHNRHLLYSASELPQCEGPKLKAFPHRNSPVTWIEWINQTTDAAPSGGQGYVFKVQIKSRTYALKVFKFFYSSINRMPLGPIREKNVTDSELEFHTDPFYAECRAYAHIKAQKKKQGLKRKDIADCYGFLALKKEDEDVLTSYGVDPWSDYTADHEYRKRFEGSPVRALVKEYIADDVDMDQKTRKRMLASVKWMNRNNILINDVAERNFKGGYLLDFGLAWTKPHCLWQNLSRAQLPIALRADIVMFEEMLDELGFGWRRSTRLQLPQSSDET